MTSEPRDGTGPHDTVPEADTELTRLVAADTLQRLQDRFAALGQVTVCICSVSGELITQPSWGSRYSALIGNSKLGRIVMADSLRAVVQTDDRAVPSICHEGLALYATPITHDGHRLAAIVVGTRAARPPDDAQARGAAAQYGIEAAKLIADINRTTSHTGATPEATHRFADVLADTIATLYDQAQRIQRQLADLSVVYGLAELLSSTRDLQEILDLTVERVVDVLPVKACGIRLLNEETGELVIQAVHNLSDEYLGKGRVTLAENAIDAAAFAGQMVYIADAPNDPRIRYPDNARREGIVSGLCAPMTYRGQTVGVLRVYTSKRYAFSDVESALVTSIASQAASAIINARLFEGQAQARRVERQVAAAGEIQRRMLPAEHPTIPGVTFGCVYDPSLDVGGDFYDFIESPDDSMGIVVADVVGKGFPAALMMASVRSALRASVRREREVDEAVAEVNRHMCRDTLVSEFATLVYGALSPDGKTFTYCNAGHLPPLLLRGSELSELTTGGPVIGLHPDEAFQHEEIAFLPGDILAIVTDGVTEALDFDDREYGKQRLLASILRHRDLDAQQLAQQLLWDVRRFAGLARQSDDITIVVIKVA